MENITNNCGYPEITTTGDHCGSYTELNVPTRAVFCSTVREIFVRTVFKGTHCWGNCPHDDVGFLRNEHHHEFNVEVTTHVDHSDRDIEFIKLQRWVDRYISNTYPDGKLGSMSCEMVAENLATAILTTFKREYVTVKVDEDSHYGGIVTVREIKQ